MHPGLTVTIALLSAAAAPPASPPGCDREWCGSLRDPKAFAAAVTADVRRGRVAKAVDRVAEVLGKVGDGEVPFTAENFQLAQAFLHDLDGDGADEAVLQVILATPPAPPDGASQEEAVVVAVYRKSAEGWYPVHVFRERALNCAHAGRPRTLV